MSLLNNDTRKRLLSESIDRSVQKHDFNLMAYVYMPEHIHLIVFSQFPGADVARLLYGIKRPFSYRIKKEMERTGDPLLNRLMVRERPGKVAFRFWLEGPGYDRNLTTLKAVKQAVEYVHRNPVRRGLCHSPNEWKWSSWRHYHEPNELPDPDMPTVHGIPD
jgi:putative transposase